jgi:Tfp pilus assembly protein PilF
MAIQSLSARGSSVLPNGFRAVTLALAAIVFVAFAMPAAAQVSTGRGRLNGIVMDLDGNPIGGATVRLTHVDTGDSWEVTTSDDGRWLKGNMGSGAWTVDFLAPGYLPGGISVAIQALNRSKPVQTYLEPGEAAPAASAAPTGAFSTSLTNKIKEGNELAAAGDHAGALAHFEQIFIDFPQESNQYVYLVNINAGNSAFELGDLAKAKMLYERVVAMDPSNTEGRMALAKAAMMERDLETAQMHLAEIDLDEITDPIVFYNIGSLLFEQGQSAEAQVYYEGAIERNPDFADAHMQLALCLVQQGKMDEAKGHLEKVVELDPNSQNGALAQDFLNSIG